MEELQRELNQIGKKYALEYPSSSKEQEFNYIHDIAEEKIKNNFPGIYQQKNVQNGELKRIAEYLYDAGRALNKSDRYEQNAEKFLEKSARIAPENANIWLELGLCVSKRNDLEFARICFQKSADLHRTPRVLTSLAITIRSISDDPKQLANNRKIAMKLLKEAIEMDENLGIAQSALGTGYFLEFFNSIHLDLSILEQACQCYRKSLSCEDQKNDPQVNLNLATALRYMENYKDCLIHSIEASKFDPRNDLGSKNRLNSLITYLQKFYDATEKKGRLKPKRLQTILESFNRIKNPSNSIIIAKVVSTITHEEQCPLTMSVIDCTGTCFGVTVYNCATSFGYIIGDTITIEDPDWRTIENLELPTNPITKIEKLRWCRVATPRQLTRNSAPVGFAVLSPATVTVEK